MDPDYDFFMKDVKRRKEAMKMESDDLLGERTRTLCCPALNVTPRRVTPGRCHGHASFGLDTQDG